MGGLEPPLRPPPGYATGPWPLRFAWSIPVLGLERFCPRKGCAWPWIFLCPWPRALCSRLHLCYSLQVLRAQKITVAKLQLDLGLYSHVCGDVYSGRLKSG